ncbi:unnamed protein product [Calypogeia fissa]
MWSTIANFKDNLSQIASDVLDTADELKRGGSQDDYDDELFDDSHATSHRSSYKEKEADLKAELEWYRNEVPRLQAAESRIQSTCLKYISALKDKEDELLRLRDENGILKEKLSVATSESSFQALEDRGKVQQLQEALKKQVADLQVAHQKQRDLLIAQHKKELANVDALHGPNHSSEEKDQPSIRNGPVPHLSQDAKVQNLESELLQVQKNVKELSSQLLDKDKVYGKLRSAHDRSLSEVRRLKEQLSKHKEASLQKDSQLERGQEAAETAAKECEALRFENLKMSDKLGELQKSLDELDATTGKSMKESELTISDLLKSKTELEAQRNGLLKQLEDHAQRLLEQTSTESAEVVSEKELRALKETAAEVDRLLERAKEAEDASASQKLEFENQLDQVMAERDKAIRDLARLRQHLLDKERADSEKMDQDSEQIADLQARADLSTARAVKAEQALSVALTDLREARQLSKEELSKATEEIAILQQKLASCIAALESKDVELSNLQSALGQYYAESEAQDRVYLELSAAKEECGTLSQQLQKANKTVEVKDGEKEAALEKLVISEKRISEKEQKLQKLEEEVLRLRRALEQSMTRLNILSSDSDYHVDRRIVIKLLVTYFQKNHSREVLDLMVRMLGFSEEDKRRVGLAQQVASRGYVRGVLGLPGRFVGGIIGSASSDSLSLPSTDNKSFADLWIDFLLKESEERERREKAEASGRAEGKDGSGTSSSSSQQVLEPSGYDSSVFARGSISMPPSPSRVISHRPTNSFSNFSSAFPSAKESSTAPSSLEIPPEVAGSANGKVLVPSRSSDAIGNEFASIPLNSSSAAINPAPNLAHLKLPPRI